MRSYLKLFRFHQWTKNLLIFAPLFFSGTLLSASGSFGQVALVTLLFSLLASSVYVGNDIVDRKQDALHPIKKFRPIASGLVSVKKALLIALFLSGGSLFCLSILSVKLFLLGSGYVLLNIFYSLFLKHIPLLDIVFVSLFYLIRIIVGGVAAGVSVSDWLILCSLFLSLFLVVAKRKAEYVRDIRREVLSHYSLEILSAFLLLTASCTIMSYALYAVLGAGHRFMVYSTIFVFVGVMRYFMIASKDGNAESPEKVLFVDPYVWGSIILWLVFIAVLFYMPR